MVRGPAPRTRRVPQPRLKVWVVFGGRVKLGDGRAALLERIEQLGSFKQAVAELGMSYRGAWGYFRELEHASGICFLERHPGRGPAGGTRLTAEGKRFLARYRRFRHGLDALVARRFRASFRPERVAHSPPRRPRG